MGWRNCVHFEIHCGVCIDLPSLVFILTPNMSSSTTQTYSSLRSDLRHQENKTEITLAELSSLTNSPPSQEDIQIEDRLVEIFAQRRATIDAMSRLLDSDPSGGGARVHQLARAREILGEHEKEFRRMKVLPDRFQADFSRRSSRLAIERRSQEVLIVHGRLSLHPIERC